MTNYNTEEEEYLPTTSISYNTGSININECSLQTIWTSTNTTTNNNNIPNVMPVSDSSNSTLTFNTTTTTTNDREKENNLIDSSQCVNLDNSDLVSSASESSLLDTTSKPTTTNNNNDTTNANNNNNGVIRQRFAEHKLSEEDSITPTPRNDPLRLSDLSSKTPPIFARDNDMNKGGLRGSFTRDDTPRRGTLFTYGSSPKQEVPLSTQETKAETSRQSTTEQCFEDSNNTVLNSTFDTTTTGTEEEEESPSFDTNNNLFRRQSTGVTSSNYDTYTNYDPVESVVGGYSTLDISRRSSNYNGNGLDYSKRSGSCGLFSIYDDVDNNIGEEEGRQVPIWIKNRAASGNKAASVQSGHTELLKQHSLVDWAEYPTSPGDEEDDMSNVSAEEEEEDFADDDVSEEHYRSLDRRCSINNRDKGVSSPKEDTKEGKGEEVSNNQLVVREVLDPEEASFAEQERLTEYDETKAVIVPDSTPSVPDTKTPSSKGIVQQQSQSPSATGTIKHTNDNNKPIDTSKQYNGFQHTFITIKEEHRFLMLYTFLKRNVNAKIIIFFSTTKSTQYYCKLLQRLKFTNVNCVHNGMGRDRFMNALVEFSSNGVGEGDSDSERGNSKGSILCIPDFQASDISIPPSTTWLVQFEPPANPTEYIYRVGRISSETTTASSNSSSSHRRTRSNSTGSGSNSNHPTTTPSRALLFLTPNEYGFLKYYKAANIKIYEYEISKIAKIQKQIVKLVHDDNKLCKLGVEAYHAYLGTYASHEYKDIYDTNDDDTKEDKFEMLIAKCFGFESIPGKVIPSTKRVVSNNNRKSLKRNDKLRGSLVKKQDSKDKLRGSLVKKKESKDKVVPQDDEEKVTTTPQGKKKSKVSQDEKKVMTPQDKKKKVPQDNSPRASRTREQNRWKPVKHEQRASWMSGKTKSWRASNVHADKMKIQSKKNLDEYHPKIVKLPKAA